MTNLNTKQDTYDNWQPIESWCYEWSGNAYSVAAIIPSKLGWRFVFSFFVILFDREEMAIDEAELEPRELAEKLHAQQILQKQVKQHTIIVPVETFMLFIIKAANYMVWLVAAATEHASWNEEI